MFVCRNSFEGLLYYLPTIVKSYNLFPDSHLSRNTVTLFLSSPPALVAAALALFLAWSSNRRKERTWHLMSPLLVAFLTLAFTSGTATTKTSDVIFKYVCMYFYLAGTISSSGLAWSWVPNAIQETPEKKACAIAIVSVFGGLGAIWAPFLFRKQDYPDYRLAFGALAGFTVIEMACCGLMRTVLYKKNKTIRDGNQDVGGVLHADHTQLHML